MTANEKRVKRLSKMLPNRDEYVREHGCYLVDSQWDAHHCGMITLSEHYEDYQIVRHYDVEIDVCFDEFEKMNDDEQKQYDTIENEHEQKMNDLKRQWDNLSDGFILTDTQFARDLAEINKAAEEKYKELQRNIEHEFDKKMDSLREDIMYRLEDETGDPYHDFFAAEIMQEWVNVVTGEITYLGRPWAENPRLYDEDGRMKILRPARYKQHRTFLGSFLQNLGEGHYEDIDVHPALQAVGYKGISEDGISWFSDREMYEDPQAPISTQFVNDIVEEEPYGSFLYGLIRGKGSKYDGLFKAYGQDAVFHVYGKEQDYQRKYFAAIKIANRNHYEIADMGMWNDLVDCLIWLDKDVHNAHYVCPADLKEAHDRWVKLRAKKQKEIDRKKRIAEAIQFEEEYEKRIGKYFNIDLKGNGFHIYVCPSVAAMAEEGAAMRHCVYQLGYYKAQKNCIICFVRDDNGNRISTMELDGNTFRIKQNRGVCNKVPMYLNEANQLVMDNIKLFQNAGKKQKEKVISINQPLTQAA